MADLRVDAIDDRFALRANVVDALIEVENPAERLLRRADVSLFSIYKRFVSVSSSCFKL
jgi:hypothetical protein